MNDIERRLGEAGITLPVPPRPAANYVPAAAGQGLLFVAGQGPNVDGKSAVIGRLGAEVDAVFALR